MRYLTKEWYNLPEFFGWLKADERAEDFSQSFFEAIYGTKESQYVEMQRRIWSVNLADEATFNRIHPENFVPRRLDGSSLEPEEAEQARAEYLENRKKLWEAFQNQPPKPPFDEDEKKKEYELRYTAQLSYLKKALPQEILDEAADIRVLALGYAAPAVKEKIDQYGEENKKKKEQIYDESRKACAESFGGNPPAFLDVLDCHDYMIIDFRMEDGDLILTHDNGGMLDTHGVLTFRNAEIIEKEEPMVNSELLYEEVYRINGRYELQALLSSRDDQELKYLTVRFSDVRLEQIEADDEN